MKKITSAIIICLLIVAGTSCLSKTKKERTINISGAFALYPLVVKWADEYKKEHPEVRFNITGGGAGKGLADAMSGAVDIGMFSREFSPEEIKSGVWWVGLTIDAVVPTINSDNPMIEKILARGLTRDEFADIFINGKIDNWNQILGPESDCNITIYTRSDACGAAETWAKYLGGKQENLVGVGIFADPGIADAVARDRYGIGYNNTIFVYDLKTGGKRQNIEIIPIDINGNGLIDDDERVYDTFNMVLDAIANGRYPSPPARELYFVTRGKPQKESVLNFIEWTLTKGQIFVKEAGYVPLNQDVIDNYVKGLRE